ncbi:site-2 protease family protein [Lewinella sp. W8]|uniref:site-2 protease family protein n=1 Tax=Lewinella sp. W8 TaxID=2528208 RepID=UPI001068CC13|nr:site-2 protease family protein [Lewinella sp. W8]MTB51417.1 hypothetical protein [Lewinella sp. W8]
MKKILSFFGLLLVGAFFGYAMAKLFLGDASDLFPKQFGLFFILLLPLSFLFVVGVHELGHVLFGRWQNFEFFGLTVGPFSWRPDENGNVRFAWNTSLNLAGGVAVMLPNGGEQLSQRFTWFAAGGPLSSLLLALLLYVLSSLLPAGSFLAFMAGGLSLLSAVIFLATILPFRAGGFASDGMRILTFWRGGKVARADIAGLQTIAHIRTGKPYRELPLEDMVAVAEDPDIPEQQRVTMDYYRYLVALSENDVDRAGELLDSVMDRLDAYPPGVQGTFYAELALFKARYRRDLKAAESAWEKFTPIPLTEAASIHLTKAAIADLREDYTALSAELPGLKKGLPKMLDQSRRPIIEYWVREWEEKVASQVG